jgi:hypothetical protein
MAPQRPTLEYKFVEMASEYPSITENQVNTLAKQGWCLHCVCGNSLVMVRIAGEQNESQAGS